MKNTLRNYENTLQNYICLFQFSYFQVYYITYTTLTYETLRFAAIGFNAWKRAKIDPALLLLFSSVSYHRLNKNKQAT